MWNEIRNDNDIKQLFDCFEYFHDSCIVSMNFETGLDIDNQLYMNYGSNRLNIVFKRQSTENNSIEIEFSDVMEYICPKKLDDINEILDVLMFFDKDIIYWADSNCFDIKLREYYDGFYISSKKVRWRIK